VSTSRDAVPSPSVMLRRFALATSGLVLLGLIWQVIGVHQLAGRGVPPLTKVLRYLFDQHNRKLFTRALQRTGSEAAKGFVIGVILATVLATIASLVPALHTGVTRLSSLVSAAPWVALGPVFAILSRDNTPVTIAVLAVFFNCFVAISSGLGAADRQHERVFRTLGASGVSTFRLLSLPTAIPALCDGLRLAVPAAMLGAIFGEWFGSTRGIGILLVSSMQNLRIEQLWAAAMLAAGMSLVGYALFTGLHRVAKARLT
jgi:ABC-type nitrate/sulfonate/bicarbonate transport system permease component